MNISRKSCWIAFCALVALFFLGATARVEAAVTALSFDGANDYVTFCSAPGLGLGDVHDGDMVQALRRGRGFLDRHGRRERVQLREFGGAVADFDRAIKLSPAPSPRTSRRNSTKPRAV